MHCNGFVRSAEQCVRILFRSIFSFFWYFPLRILRTLPFLECACLWYLAIFSAKATVFRGLLSLQIPNKKCSIVRRLYECTSSVIDPMAVHFFDISIKSQIFSKLLLYSLLNSAFGKCNRCFAVVRCNRT